MLLVEGFQKFAGIPFGISRIFESLMPQQISANRRKNRSIQVQTGWQYEDKQWINIIVSANCTRFIKRDDAGL